MTAPKKRKQRGLYESGKFLMAQQTPQDVPPAGEGVSSLGGVA